MQGLAVGIHRDLIAGRQLFAGIDPVLFDKIQVLLADVRRERVSTGAQVLKASALGFDDPFIGIVVAVEDDAGVLLERLADEGADVLFEFVLRNGFQDVREAFQLFGEDGVQHGVRACQRGRGAHHTEFELVAREGKGRCTVAVRIVLLEFRDELDAGLHFGGLDGFHGLARLDGILQSQEVVPEIDGDDGGRRLVRAETVVVSGARDTGSEEILVLVDTLDHGGQHDEEDEVVERVLAGFEQVDAGIGGDGPVIVFAGTVDAGKRLFMDEAREVVLLRNGLHDLHRQLVLVGADIGVRVDRRHLVLRRCDFVVLGLRVNTEFPQFHVEVGHEGLDRRLDGAEIVVLHLLALRGLGAEKGASGSDEVFPLVEEVAVDEEILLLTADGGTDMLRTGGVSEDVDDAHGLLVDGLDGAEQRSLLVEDLSAVGAEDGRDAEGVILDERRRGRVPGGIAPRLEGGADAAGRERGRIGFGSDELFAGEVHDDLPVAHRSDEAVVLLRGDAGHGLEPVGVVRGTFFYCPGLHGTGDLLRDLRVQRLVVGRRLFQGIIGLVGESLMHDFVREQKAAEDLRYIVHTHLVSSYKKSAVPLRYSAIAVFPRKLYSLWKSLSIIFSSCGRSDGRSVRSSAGCVQRSFRVRAGSSR